MDTINTIYNALPPAVWAFIFGTPAIVGFVNLCKKLFGVNSTLVIHTLTATTAFLITAIPDYVLNNPKPFTFLGAYTTAFFTAANFLYALSKRAQPFLNDVKTYEDKRKAVVDTGATVALATAASVSSTEPAKVTQIPVQDPTVFEG